MIFGGEEFLPGTGRGTIRRMVEGAGVGLPTMNALCMRYTPLHPDAARRGPPPRAGEELL